MEELNRNEIENEVSESSTFISPLRETASHKINKDARASLPF